MHGGAGVIRVLVVDDDFMVAKVHSGFVNQVPGFRVVGVAHDGRQALEQTASLAPDLVLLDVYLPDMTGTEMLEELRRRGSTVEVLVVSAARDLPTVQRAFHGGAVGYLVKPFDQAALAERLNEFAGRHRHLAGVQHTGQEPAQDDIDLVFSGPRVRARPTMPKGLTAETAELVRAALSAAPEGLSAGECAALTGLARVSARRYLEHLVSEGQAEVRQRYGVAGRPQRRFNWTGDPAT
jgi:two-component system CitB family response regulator